MLKERIKTFVELGYEIKQFLEAENPKKINPELADLLHRHKHYNPWFTAESIEYALANLLPMLEKKMLESFCCLLYTSPSPRDRTRSRMPSSA